MPIKIRETGDALAADVVEAARGVDLATLGHFLEVGFVDPEIHRITGDGKLVGRAVTVRVIAPDSALVHRATELLEPGDVLVVDLGGDRRHAPVGGVVAEAVAASGAVGMVIDGRCTDAAALARLSLSTYARGVAALTTKLHALDAGGINVPVSIGGAAVLPGYIVIGDDDGLLITDPDDVITVLDRARAAETAEPAKLARLRSGEKLSEVSAAGARLRPLIDREEGAN